MASFGVVLRLSVRTRNSGVFRSNAKRATMKTPLARKATGNHLIKFTSLEKTRIVVFGFCFARNRVCDAVSSAEEP